VEDEKQAEAQLQIRMKNLYKLLIKLALTASNHSELSMLKIIVSLRVLT
jgi:hypothetical protein